MSLNDTTNPQLGELTVRVTSGSTAVEFTRALEYSLRENWLEPTDSFSFSLDQKELSKTDLAAIVPGAVVEPCVDGHVQSRMVLDEVVAVAAGGEGSVVHCECRDWLSYMVDSQVDVQSRFNSGMSLIQLVAEAAAPFGVTMVVADSIANRNVITGRTSSEQSSASAIATAQRSVASAQALPDSDPNKASKLAYAQSQLQQVQQAALAQRAPVSKKGRVSKHFQLGEWKPYPNEGAFAFVSRVAQRFGLWVRPYVDGETIVLAGPDFDQAPRYGICHALDARSSQNNVLRAHFAKSRREQPSIIYAYSPNGGGAEFPKARLHAGIVNPTVDADNSAIIGLYQDVPLVELDEITAAFPPFIEQRARPAFLVDRESHTQEQLEAFLRRELSLRMRKALTARFEIMGHKLNDQPVAVDTIVSVLDQQPAANWNGPLWVLARHFSKSVHTGARTTIECLLPGSIQF